MKRLVCVDFSSSNVFLSLAHAAESPFAWRNLFIVADLVIIVPARLASKRFPRKLLHLVRGKPLILWTAERLVGEVPEIPIHFAVADEELKEVLKEAGHLAHLTDPELPTGTDRVAAVNEKLGASMVINAQADEPLVAGQQLRALAKLLENGSEMCTLACPFENEEDFRDPNQVKVVLDQGGKALYFSRSPIPFNRADTSWVGSGGAFRHLGLYGYSKKFLLQYVNLSQTLLEQSERLEQLRALEHGHSIAVALTHHQTIGIDVPDDVARFEKCIDEHKGQD
jgi:3-deoxy-manno-octulosonate cytidylyltransferase (CMP-KDO synthetase)